MMTYKNFLDYSEPIFNTAKECKFGELGLLTPETSGYTSYTIEVDVSDFTPKEGGRNFAVALVAALDDITVRLLEDDVEFYCSAGDGFGSGTDIGCYADEDKPLTPMLYTLEVKVSQLWRLLDSPVELPTIKGLIFGGNDVCQGIGIE